MNIKFLINIQNPQTTPKFRIRQNTNEMHLVIFIDPKYYKEYMYTTLS